MCHSATERSVVKVVIVACTVLHCVAGVLLFSFGIVLSDPETKFSQSRGVIAFDFNVFKDKDIILSSAIFSIIYGAVVIIVSLVGIEATVNENHNRFKRFTGLNAIAFGLGIVFLLVVAFYPPSSIQEREMRRFLISNFSVQDIGIDGHKVIAPKDKRDLAWANTQFKGSCCGVGGIGDYRNMTEIQKTETINGTQHILMVPLSCCETRTLQFPATITDFVDFEQCLNGSEPSSFNSTPCFNGPYIYTWLCFTIFFSLGLFLFGIQIGIMFNQIRFLKSSEWTAI